MKKRRLLPLTLPALALVVAAPAFAVVSLSYSPDDLSLSVSGDNAGESLVLSCVGGEVAPAPPVPAPCSTLATVGIFLGGGSDGVDLSALTAEDFPDLREIRVVDDEDSVFDSFVGSELDEIFDVGSQDNVDAGDGDDVITGGDRVDGGPGDDVLVDALGRDADGGPGDDRFVQSLGSDGTDGGAGYDVLQVDFDRAGTRFDGLVMTATAAQLQLVVGDEEQDTFVANFEELHLRMPRGDLLTFDASTFPGRVVWAGSRERDTVVGSAFRDHFEAGPGDDTVEARDGVVDVVDCGAGDDTAVVDPDDLVIDCETVSYPRPSTSAITGPRAIVKGARASYAFSSSIDDSVFQCRIDRGAWKRCTSPTTVVARKKLSKGRHTLFVRAGFPAGNWDTTPSKKRFRITRR